MKGTKVQTITAATLLLIALAAATALFTGLPTGAIAAPSPATIDAEQLCRRTPEVKAAILEGIPGASATCVDADPDSDPPAPANYETNVTPQQLAGIAELDLRSRFPTVPFIREFKSGDFQGLTGITTLIIVEQPFLSKNGLADAGVPASILAGLDTLYFSNSDLIAIRSADFFKGLSNLRELDVTINNMTYELPGNPNRPEGTAVGRLINREAWQHLPNLRKLSIGSNRILTLPPGFFEHLDRLEELDMFDMWYEYHPYGFGSQALPAGIFEGLTNLRKLDLGYNAIGATEVHDGLFDGLTALEVLDLRQNPLLETLPRSVLDLPDGVNILTDPGVRYPTDGANQPATGSPVVRGNARVGQTLTASVDAIQDEDGINDAQFACQWRINAGAASADIPGATEAAYTLTDADEGKTVRVRVSFTDDAGNEETLISAATAAVAPEEPPARPQGLTGTVAHYFVSLTWNDPGDASITGYQILRLDRDVHGLGNFQVHVDDTGSAAGSYVDWDVEPDTRYVYRIKARNGVGLSERSDYFRADTPSAPEPAPDVSDLGDITDLARPQFPLGTLDGATVSYRFELTERRKVGLGLREQETDADLVVEDADGDVLGASRNAGTANEWMTITLLAGTYYVRLEAQETGVSEFVFRYGVEAAPNRAATGAPVIGGTARVGETLTADTSGIGDADGLSGVSFSYRWIRSDGNTNTDISGATAATYTLAASDEGKTIRVRVSFTDDAGHGETLTSAATAAVVARSNNPATGAPVIDGTARVGETLRADTSGIADDDGLSNAVFGYRWVANDGTTDTDISGATASTYTVAASDEGKTIRVRVSFTDDAGHDETLSSASTAAVAAEPEPEPQEPPAMPQGLTGSAVHDAVTLAWDDPGDDSITGYQILRRNRAIHAIGDFQIHVEDTSSAAASHVDRDVEPDGSYVYRIKARNGAGLSERSDYYRVDTPVASNRPATGAPVIGGTARVGETLRADISSIADEDGLENATFGYRWIADGSEILNQSQGGMCIWERFAMGLGVSQQLFGP